MCAVLDDLVVALYVTVDELLGKRSRPGRPPRLSDAELVCLAVAQVLATPKLGEREVAAALLGGWPATRLLRPGMVIAADKGLAGHRFAQGVGQLGAVLVRPDRRDEPHRWGSLGGIRQWIEGIIDTLKDQLGLERHGAHTPQGLWVRVTQRLLALAAGIWFNWQLGVADKRNLVAYDPGFKSPQLHHHRSAGQLALEAMDFGCGSLGQACRPARVNPPVAVIARERELALSVRRLAALYDRLSGR